jgi:hypothetical protein
MVGERKRGADFYSAPGSFKGRRLCECDAPFQPGEAA